MPQFLLVEAINIMSALFSTWVKVFTRRIFTDHENCKHTFYLYTTLSWQRKNKQSKNGHRLEKNCSFRWCFSFCFFCPSITEYCRAFTWSCLNVKTSEMTVNFQAVIMAKQVSVFSERYGDFTGYFTCTQTM